MTAATPAILVVGPSWVGDMVMAQSLFMRLVEQVPRPYIHVLAPGWTRPLLERMPEVEGSLEMPVGHGRLGLLQRLRLGRRVAGLGFDQAIILPNSIKSALVPWWAGIPRRTGWRGEMRFGLLNDIRRLDADALPMTVQRFVALGLPPGADPEPVPIPIPSLQVRQEQVTQARQSLGLQEATDRPILALCPGAEYGPAKQWPAAYYGELARLRHAQGWDPWLFGSKKDRQVCAEINSHARGVCRDLTGRTGLGEAVDLMSQADAVVSNDSGLMHVAAALGRPLVAIYGSSDPSHTPPLGGHKHILYRGLECSPCFRRICPLGHTDCLHGIRVEQVSKALDGLTAA